MTPTWSASFVFVWVFMVWIAENVHWPPFDAIRFVRSHSAPVVNFKLTAKTTRHTKHHRKELSRKWHAGTQSKGERFVRHVQFVSTYSLGGNRKTSKERCELWRKQLHMPAVNLIPFLACTCKRTFARSLSRARYAFVGAYRHRATRLWASLTFLLLILRYWIRQNKHYIFCLRIFSTFLKRELKVIIYMFVQSVTLAYHIIFAPRRLLTIFKNDLIEYIFVRINARLTYCS